MSLMWLLALGCTSPPASRCGGDAVPPGSTPADLEAFRLDVLDETKSEMAHSYLLLTQLDDRNASFASVIDGCGDHVWWNDNDNDDDKHMRARVSRDGRSVVIGARHKNTAIDIGEIRHVDIETGEILRTRALDHHHDFVELPDGTIGYLSRDLVPDRWFDGKYPLAVDRVRTATPGSAPSEHGDIVQILDDLEVRPWFTCSHMAHTQFLKEKLDWTHTNSLVFDDDTGEWTLGVRHFDGVLRLDRDGAFRWWLGGTFSTLAAEEGTLPLRHAHFTEAWHDGLIAFDNRNHDPDRSTRIVELQVDEEAGTYREVWSYEHPEGLEFAARGDVRQLPGGNVLIAWTRLGQIWEVTRDGEVVWSVDTDHKVVRMEFVPTWPPGPASD